MTDLSLSLSFDWNSVLIFNNNNNIDNNNGLDLHNAFSRHLKRLTVNTCFIHTTFLLMAVSSVCSHSCQVAANLHQTATTQHPLPFSWGTAG